MNAAQYRKELVENIEHNALGPNDTFQFTCKECGECCRNRATPVMLTGLDSFTALCEIHANNIGWW